MNYPEEFKQKVLAALPNVPEMKEFLDSGNMIVGRILDDSRFSGPSAEEVVVAVESNSLEGIYAKAKRSLALQALYSEWADLYHEQYQPQGKRM